LTASEKQPQLHQEEKNTIPIRDIIIKERYRKEFGDINALADNIKNVGLLQPIVINNENNELIDGQRRILAFESLSKKEIPCFKVDLQKIVLGEFSENYYRKDCTISEMVAIKRAIEPYEKKKAKERMLAGKPCVKLTEGGNSSDKVAGFVGVSRNTLKKAEEIVTAAETNSEKYQQLLEEVDSGKMSVNEASKIIEKDKQREEKRSENQPVGSIPPEDRLLLINDDFTKVSRDRLASKRFHLIVTDPYYGQEYLPLYEYLAKFSNRELYDGDGLVFITGHIILDKVFQIFSKYPDLKFWWIFAIEHSGPSATTFTRKMFPRWKPALYFVKGKESANQIDTMPDLIKSTKPDKSNHEMAQSTVEFEHMIKYLTVENQTILDPFMGNGNSIIAGLKLNRKCIIIEIDKKRFDDGVNKIKESLNEMRTGDATKNDNEEELEPEYLYFKLKEDMPKLEKYLRS